MAHRSNGVLAWTLALCAVLPSTGAYAQTLQWDANGATAGSGGTGTWDTTASRWFNGSTYQAWNNGALNDAVFASTAGTVTLGTPITVHNLNFNTTGYTLTGSTLTLGGVTPTITVNPALTTTINSIVGGTAGLTKTGTGTLVLSGVNTYSGLTLVQSGTLSLTNSSALGAAPNIAANFVLANGTTLNFNATTINRDFTLNGGVVNMAATTGTYTGSPTLAASTELRLTSAGTFSSNFADTGPNVLSLTRNGAGTVILNGSNSYSGATQVSAGVLRLGSAGALSANSNLALSGNAILELAAGNLTSAVGTGAGQVQWTGGAGFGALGATRIVNLGGAGAMLTWAGTPGFIGDGQTLQFSSTTSTGTLDFRNALDLNGAARTLQINNGTAATDAILNGVISNGSVVYSGAGTVSINAANSYTGSTTLNGSPILLSAIGNGGSNGAFGAATSDAANLVFNSNTSTLTYNGAGESTDRNFTIGAPASQVSIFANGSGALAWNGAPSIASGSKTLLLRGTNVAANTFAGVLADGGGTLSLTKADAGTWRLAGSNTYTGITSVTGGTLELATLANGGVASALGRSSNAAANLLLNNSGLRYVGSSATSTDRNFTGTTAPRIESSGTGSLTWNGTLTPTNALNFTLGGTNTGANLFAGALTDFNTAGAARTGLIKSGAGAWSLSGLNLHTGDTRIDAGLLRLDSAAALSGGLASGGATTGSLLNFNGGVLGLTAASGDFNRGVSTTQFLNNVRWQGSGGFAAFGGDRSVNLGGAGALLTWGAAGFVPAGQSLNLGFATADSTIDFRNDIGLGNVARTVVTNDGSAAVDAILSGVLSGAGGGLTKTGAGRLALTNSNTYTGITTIGAGVLQIGTGGTTGTLGTGNVTDTGQLAINRSDAFTVGQIVSGTGSFRQMGSGTTTLTGANTYTGATFIDAGTLQIGNGGATGAMGTGALTNNATLAFNRNNALTVANVIGGTGMLRKDGIGTTTLTGLNTFTGGVRLNAGVLAVGNLQNGAVASNLGASGNAAANLDFDGGTLRYTGAASGTNRNFLIEDDGATIDGSGTGVLTWSGSPSYDVVDQARNLTLTGTTNGNLFAGSLTDNGVGALSLTKAGTSRWILAGNNTNSGTTTISAGTLQVGNNGTTGSLGSGAVVNNATLTFQRSDALSVANNISGTGTISQSGAGTTQLGGAVAANATNVTAGTLQVNGSLTTQTITLATTLDVRGTAEAAGATTTAITGSTAVNTVRIGSGATLRATGDLGAGNDVLDVAGVLNTGAGTLTLGANDDTFVLRDGASILGALNGGTGINSLNADIAGLADLGPASLFQTLTKNGAGTLNINNALSGLATVNANAGTINVAAAGGISGVVTTSVATGSTLNVAGSYTGSAGNDSWTVAGTVSGSGTIDFGAGNDTLTLADGAAVTRTILGGAQTTMDSVVMNNAAALSLDGAMLSGFERLTKQNTGIATLTGTHGYTSGAALNVGTLSAAGTLNIPTLTLADGTTFQVTGVAQAAGAGRTTITGSNGANTIVVGSGATLRATGGLGTGDDVLDVAGTLDLGAATFDLNIGDDTFTIHDGTNIIGTVAGGAGVNTFNTDIAGAANLGAVTGFQSLLKTGGGTLNINGPPASSFSSVTASAGTINVAATGSLTNIVNTTVASGATLNVTGNYSGSAGADTFALAGAVSGAGAISLGAGDDTLWLNDGASLGSVINGGTQTTADSLVLNNTSAFSFGATGAAGFERLTKQNSGVATLTGSQTYTAGTNINAGTLSVAGTLTSPTVTLGDSSTFDVRGLVEAAGASPTAMIGSAGSNFLTIASGAMLRATGDLGDGADVLDISGTLNSGAGTLTLGAGDDTLTIHDGTTIVGSVVGGAGINTFNTDIATTANLTAVNGFQTLLKTSAGSLNIDGPGTSNFTTVNASAGTVNVTAAGSIAGVVSTHVASGATLRIDGSYQGSASDDTFLVAGSLRGAGSVDLGAGADLLDVTGSLNLGSGVFDLGTGDDTFTIHDGTSIVGTVAGGAGINTFNTDIAGSADLGSVTGFQSLLKTGTGTLNINGPAASAFSSVAANAGTINVAATGDISDVTSTVVANGATLTVNGSYAGSSSADTFAVAGTVSGAGLIDLGAGDDVVTLNDGAVIDATISAGSQSVADTLVLDNAATLSVDSGAIAGFEQLTKQNAGTATLTGIHAYSNGTAINAGTLAVSGTLNSTTIGVGDNSTLAVSGTVQAPAAAPTSITGTSGVNTITVASGALLHAAGNLGDGADVLDVTGTLNTGAGALDLGDGDDTFTVHDGTRMLGAVAGGAGINTFNTDIAGVADLGAITGFQSLLKTGVGTLNIDGPAVSVFDVVAISGGTLHVASGATIDPGTTTVGSGATLQVDGSYLGTAGNDTMTVAGTVSGSGSVDLGLGDDVLTLDDGAVIAASVGGGGQTIADRIVLNTAASFTLDDASLTGFELLSKQGAGLATLTGNQSYTAANVDAGTLAVSGTLNSPTIAIADAGTLLVLGTAQGAPASAATITGSAGANTVNVVSGATLRATGDLGDGADLLDVAGVLDTGSGTLSLGDGDDTFTIHDGTVVSGTVVGGSGINTFATDIAGAANLGAVSGFQSLVKTGAGALNINGPAASQFSTVAANAGTINVAAAGSITGVTNTQIASGATLDVAGSYAGSAGVDTFSISGTLTGAGTVDLDAGDDVVWLNDGAVLGAVIGAGSQTIADAVVLNNAAGYTLAAASVVGFEQLTKQNTGTATLTGAHGYSAGTRIDAGSLLVTGTLVSPSVALADNSMLEVTGTMQAAGATATMLSGSGGANTVRIEAGALLRAMGDLGDGADLLDIAGTFDASTTGFSLGAGDDTLTIREGTSVVGIVDGGAHAAGDTIVLDAATDMQFDAARASDFEVLTKRNTGVATLLDTPVFDAVNVEAGTLASSGLLTAARINIGANGVLSGNGTLAGDVINAGALNTGATPFSTLTIRGNYLGADGRLDLRVALGDEHSQADRLRIDGGSASGSTRVNVIHQGGLGARTTGSGIHLVEAANGATSTDDAFRLDAPVMAGAYQYDLFHGTAADTNPQGWYLRSLAPVRDMASLATAVVPAMQSYGLALIGTLHDREGSDRRAFCDGTAKNGCQWGRIWYRNGKHDGGGTAVNGATFDYGATGLQIGTDADPDVEAGRSDRAGFFFNAGLLDANADRDDGAAAGEAHGTAYSLAGYWTRRDAQRWYFDSTLVATYLSRLELDPREDTASSINGWSMAASLEGGRSFRLGSQSRVQLQAQVIGQHFEQSDAHIYGANIDFGDTNTVAGRVGLELGVDIDPKTFSGWLRASYWSELSGDARTSIAAPGAEPTILRTTFEDDWVEIAAGLAAQINEYTGVHVGVTAAQGVNGSDSSALQGNVGFRVQW
ncbi:MAG TPA: autotransporter-associated beta strand repeat-containing protein [Steroidobacteraceae bacterium]|nr:autotransporter-associated beta strand repeat-containing protein [Steroidobacteraceae bacterium]